MKNFTVRNLESPRTGNPVANQFVMQLPANTFVYWTLDGKQETLDEACEVFQSYDSLIGVRTESGKVLLDEEYHDYSATTSKYRNQFLQSHTEQVKFSIKTGSIKLVRMNTPPENFLENLG